MRGTRLLISYCSLLLLSASLLAQTFALPTPRCLYEDDECHEQRMHPDMPTINLRKLPGEETQDYWLKKGIATVEQKLSAKFQRGAAKNVAYFMGDGMSFTTISATRVYLGGEEKELAFESFTDTGLARTYAIDRLIPDSASTATALFSGVKNMYGTIGVNGNVKRGECKATLQKSNYVDSIAKWALDAGKSVGFVTNMRVTDATPAALYAHIAERNWENDKDVSDACGKSSGISDIALQLMQGDVGSRLRVVFGGGKSQFIDNKFYSAGKRRDGRNLIAEFSAKAGNKFIETKAQLAQLSAGTGNERIMGLFNDDNLLYHLEDPTGTKQPTLAEMTAKAIEILSANRNGYLLFVESGKIDLAHHENKARLALDETSELNKAVTRARQLVDTRDTLMVVTADHSHTLSISGYAARSNDIFGLPSIPADDNIPYMTLSYANGPSYKNFFDTKKNIRFNPQIQIQNSINDVFPATVPLKSETHDAEDVPVYAVGPWADIFSGVYEQSTVPHLIAYAACIGNSLKAC